MEPSFGEAIKSIRRDAGMQQKYVAYTSGIRPQRYSEIEAGQPPTDDELQEIANAINIDAPTIAKHWAKLLRQRLQG